MPDRICDNSVQSDLQYLEIHKKLIEDGRPNYCGLQIPVASKLNHEKFFQYLNDYGYWDWQLPFFYQIWVPSGH